MCRHHPVQGPEVNTQIMQEKVLGEGAIVSVVESGGQESMRNWIKQELILTIVHLTPTQPFRPCRSSVQPVVVAV